MARSTSRQIAIDLDGMDTTRWADARHQRRVVAEPAAHVQNAAAGLETQRIEGGEDSRRTAVEELPCEIDGNRHVLIDVTGVGVRRKTPSSGISRAADRPGPRRQERLARHGSERVHERCGPYADPGLHLRGEPLPDRRQGAHDVFFVLVRPHYV